MLQDLLGLRRVLQVFIKIEGSLSGFVFVNNRSNGTNHRGRRLRLKDIASHIHAGIIAQKSYTPDWSGIHPNRRFERVSNFNGYW